MKTFLWSIEYDGDTAEETKLYSGEYEVREWTTGERLKAQDSTMKIHNIESKDEREVSINARELTLFKLRNLLIKAPFEITVFNIEALPTNISDMILEEIEKVLIVKKNQIKRTSIG